MNAQQKFERDLFNELRKLVPQAIAQAKKGKPALLRILVRSVPRRRQDDEPDEPPHIIFDMPRPDRSGTYDIVKTIRTRHAQQTATPVKPKNSPTTETPPAGDRTPL